MTTISTENKLTRKKSPLVSNVANSDEKEVDLERSPVWGDQERPTTADPQKHAKIDDTKSFLRYDERRW